MLRSSWPVSTISASRRIICMLVRQLEKAAEAHNCNGTAQESLDSLPVSLEEKGNLRLSVCTDDRKPYYLQNVVAFQACALEKTKIKEFHGEKRKRLHVSVLEKRRRKTNCHNKTSFRRPWSH